MSSRQIPKLCSKTKKKERNAPKTRVDRDDRSRNRVAFPSQRGSVTSGSLTCKQRLLLCRLALTALIGWRVLKPISQAHSKPTAQGCWILDKDRASSSPLRLASTTASSPHTSTVQAPDCSGHSWTSAASSSMTRVKHASMHCFCQFCYARLNRHAKSKDHGICSESSALRRGLE